VSALVLELVEGPTLANRLERGPMKVPEALTVARQIADALEAAHEKGIVHRDLKPANIVLQKGASEVAGDVRVKLLDFGLAKTLAIGPMGEANESLTRSGEGTADGRILGTPAYMSPEQARGEALDKRTDIWAFGCVLFEVLSGRKTFEGKTIMDTLAHVLERDPDESTGSTR
jgi:serine/threonine protein kinase